MKIGDLVARVEAPTVLYRVTVSHGSIPHAFRALPYRRRGDAVTIIKVGDAWAGNGSAWRVVK